MSKSKKPMTPETRLELLIEQNSEEKTLRADISEILGGRSILSKVLNRKRLLTRKHMEQLAEYFHISPADFYLD